jgi:uncharacterized membrane protein YfcA
MAIAGLGLLAGLLIGAAGIGGVILVPSLVYFAGVSVHAAISAATASYILTGLMGTFFYARARSIKWGMAGSLSLGALPAAFLGALAAKFASGPLLETLIGVLASLSGAHALFFSRERHASDTQPVSNRALGFMGGVTGFASALTGTGGPLVLVPLLLWMQVPVLTAVGLSQVIQLPVSLLGTAGNIYNGALDLGVAGSLALGVPAGIWAGSKLAHIMPRPVLRRLVALLLVSVGILVFGKAALRLIA